MRPCAPSPQIQAAAALSALCQGADGGKHRRKTQNAVAKAGGIGPLLQLIDSRYQPLVAQATHALAMVARSNRANQDTIAIQGGIRPLVELLQSSRPDGSHNTPATQANAALAINAICRHHEANQQTVVEYGGLAQLAVLVRATGKDTVLGGPVEAESAGALWALADKNEPNKASIASAGAIGTLCQLLGASSERAHANAANALASLAFCNAANQEEVTRLLVALLPGGTDERRERVLRALWRLVEENADAKVRIAKAGGAEALVYLLRDGSPACMEYALWALSLAVDESYLGVVAERSGVVPLVKALATNDVTAMEQSAGALAKLAASGDDARKMIAKAGGIEPLVALLDGDEANASSLAQQEAAAALSELALLPANTVAIEQAGGISPLVALLCAPSFAGAGETAEEEEARVRTSVAQKKYAAAALGRLSDESAAPSQQQQQQQQQQQYGGAPDAAAALSQMGSGVRSRRRLSRAEVIAEEGAIAPLVKLLHGDRNDAEGPLEEAAGALRALASYQSNRALITESGGIGPLVSLLGSDHARAREHAEGALVRLSIENANRVLIIRQLVSMLDDSGTAAQEQAAAALANLARESTDNRVSIVEAGGIPPLLGARYCFARFLTRTGRIYTHCYWRVHGAVQRSPALKAS